MATNSRILAWEILWTEKPGGLQSMGSQRDITEHARAHTHTHTHTHTHHRKRMSLQALSIAPFDGPGDPWTGSQEIRCL